MGRKEHYCRITVYAWRETMHNVAGQTRGQRVSRLLIALFVLAIPWGWVRFVNAGSGVFGEQLTQSLIVLAAMTFVAILVFFYNLFVEGPYQVAKEERDKANELWQKLHPNAEYDAEWGRLAAIEGGPIRDRISALNAALYMIFHDWDHSTEDLTEIDQITLFGGQFKQMAQDAIDENLDIWVKRQRHGGNHVKPDHSYWEDHHLDYGSFDGLTIMARANSGGRLTDTFDPLVRKSDIERLYGPAK